MSPTRPEVVDDAVHQHRRVAVAAVLGSGLDVRNQDRLVAGGELGEGNDLTVDVEFVAAAVVVAGDGACRHGVSVAQLLARDTCGGLAT